MSITLIPEQVDEIALWVTDQGVEAEPRYDYSGRGMYGKTCIGFTMPGDGALLLGMALMAVLDEDEATEMARMLRTDSMGRDTIFYFPGVTLDGNVTE